VLVGSRLLLRGLSACPFLRVFLLGVLFLGCG
jgi:hypothetical protein